jgi:hypothetical protein
MLELGNREEWMKFFVVALFALLSLAGADRYYEYQNPTMGFAVAYPTTWQATETANKTGVALVDTAGKPQDRPAFFVSAGPSQTGVKLDDYDRIMPKLFAFVLDNYKQHLKQATTLGGAPARMLLFEASAKGSTVIGFMCYAIRNGRLYSGRDTYEKFRQIGGNILGSFRYL